VAELQGRYQVAVVNQQNRVEIRPVKTADRVDSLWVIDEGLKGGEQVVTEGLQKVGQGTLVTTRAYKP
jgi:membrane fusion protein (multidrug efflux system)